MENPRYQITEDRISYEFSDFIMKIIEPSVRIRGRGNGGRNGMA